MEDLFKFVVQLPPDVQTASVLLAIALVGYIMFRGARYLFNWLEKKNGLRAANHEERLLTSVTKLAEKRASSEKARLESLREQADMEMSLNALYESREKSGVLFPRFIFTLLKAEEEGLLQTWRLETHMLVRTSPNVLAQEQFVSEAVVWDESPDTASERAHDVLVARLRKFLSRQTI